jgi:hypothetical protein
MDVDGDRLLARVAWWGRTGDDIPFLLFARRMSDYLPAWAGACLGCVVRSWP